MFWAVSGLCLASVIAFAFYAPRVGITSLDSLLTSEKRFAEVDGDLTVFGYYRWGVSLAGIGVILGAYAVAQHGMRWRSSLGGVTFVALVLATFFSVVTSNRSELLAVLAIATLTVVAVRQREPRPTSLLFATLAALAVVATLAGLRAVGQDQVASLGSAVSPASAADNIFASGDWMDVGPLSVIVTRVPERYDYAYGRTPLSILWAPIPREVWRGKPPVRIGPELGQRVLGFDPDRRSGDPPGLIGEGWVNGGLVGVLLAMAVLGLLLRRVELLYRAGPATGGLSALPYGLLAVSLALVLPTGDVTGTVLFLLQILLPAIAVLWLARPRLADARSS